MAKTFWTATREMKLNPPKGWTFQRWEKTESSFSLIYGDCKIHLMNGPDRIKLASAHSRPWNPELKKMFYMTIKTPQEETSAEGMMVTPDELSSLLETITNDLQIKYPAGEIATIEPVRKPARTHSKRSPPGEAAVAIEYPVGTFVKVTQGPYPKVMRNVVQRIDGRRPGEAFITRWYQAKRKNVSAWVPLEHLEIVKDYKAPTDACIRHAPLRSNTARQYYQRGWCETCPQKGECTWYKREIDHDDV